MMNVNSELISVTAGSVTLADGNIYEQIYLDVRQDTPICDSVQTEQFGNARDCSLNVIYEPEPQVHQDLVYSLKTESNRILNASATEDESMAVEALRQLGSSAVYTKIPQDLPLLTCANCETQFRTTADFQNHSSICKHSQLKCYICSEMFDRPVDFNNHLVCHAVERPHSCRICSTLFIHEKDFLEHIHTHGTVANTNQCKVCGVTFNRPSSLTNHMKIHNYQPGRAILNSLALPKVEINGLNCNEIITSNVITSKNIEVSNLNQMENVNNWEDCDLIDGESFTDEVNFEVAQEMTIGSFEDDKNVVSITYEYVNDDEVKYTEEKPLKLEAATHENISENKKISNSSKKPHACNYCNKRFAREKALISHLKLHSNVLEMYYQCKNCDEYLTDEESLAKHSTNCNEELQHNANDVINNESSNQEEKAKEQDLTMVNDAKTKFYKHPCIQCSKRFSTKQKLHRHMWIHRKKTFTCEVCACSFEKQEELDRHRLSTHQGNSAYVCSECGKCFSSRQGLWEHNRVHGAMSHLYKCTECFKTFSSRQGYLIHKRAHNDERPYGCRFCWKSFRDGGTLRKHERIHTGERPHACPLCTRAFNQKVVLREHVRWLHAANWQPNENGIYNCTLCEQKLTDKDDLCAHIVKHSDHLALLAKDASKSNIKVLSNIIESNKPKQKLKIHSNKVKIELLPTMNAITDILNVNEEIVSTSPLIECDLCGDKFLNKNDLTEHVRIHI